MQYPFASPQIHCLTRFTSIIDIYDGKDIYREAMNGEEWRVAKNLHEIMMYLPDYIESTKQLEDQAFEQHEIREAQSLINNQPINNDPIFTQVFGMYHLEQIFDLNQF